ncbi:hypothetical protein H0H92_001549 [Tricholoma furcatifolium]|nr:hypothetical protein H0H92_001549 [Tricholoma furcatifolium]
MLDLIGQHLNSVPTGIGNNTSEIDISILDPHAIEVELQLDTEVNNGIMSEKSSLMELASIEPEVSDVEMDQEKDGDDKEDKKGVSQTKLQKKGKLEEFVEITKAEETTHQKEVKLGQLKLQAELACQQAKVEALKIKIEEKKQKREQKMRREEMKHGYRMQRMKMSMSTRDSANCDTPMNFDMLGGAYLLITSESSSRNTSFSDHPSQFYPSDDTNNSGSLLAELQWPLM